jgi:hypothetical protein
MQPVCLNSNCGSISGRMSILASNNCSYGWFFAVTCRWVSDVSSKENDRLAENLGPDTWHLKKKNIHHFLNIISFLLFSQKLKVHLLKKLF